MKLFQNIHFPRLAGGWLIILFSLFAGNTLLAAGIKDIAPTEADAPVMLETGRIGFNNFADYNGVAEGRLYISFGRADEVLYLGLSPEYTNDGVPFTNTISSRYQFRILRDNPDGADPVVHGPFTLTNLNANVNSYAEAEYGVYSTDQVVGGDSMYVFRPGAAGDYYIEFDDVSADGDARVNIPFWDFTVVRDGAVRLGRVWSRGWAFRTPEVTGTTPPDCVWDREFNGSLFSYTQDGFVSQIDFQDSGFQGLSFNIAFNETGPGTSGDLAEDRKSVPGVNETINARQHRIFLSLPDIEIFPDGICGEVTAGGTFICGGDDPYCLEVEVTRQGQVEVILDFDGNGMLDDNGRDVALVYNFTADSLTACIPWDGLRGDSTPVSFTDTINVVINYAQGVQHYSAYDVEFLKNGFCVETVRPTCNQELTSNRLFYDDRDIPEASGTGAPKDGRDGCDCGDGCRTWNNFSLNPGGTCDTFDDEETVGYGDKSTINTYWFASSQSEFRARVPVISANIVGPTELCDGETSLLTAIDNGVVGTPAFVWDGPGVDGLTTDTVRISQAGTYCVTVFDPSGCENRTCTDVTVVEFDASPFPDGLTICFGESVTLPVGGNPAYDYLWSPSIGIDDINSNQPTFNPTETTTYSVVITNSISSGSVCTATEEITITVSPDIDLQVVGGGPICDPTTTISATTAVEADIVLFDPSGTQIGTGGSFTLEVSGESDYLIVATDAQNCKDSITFTVSGGPVNIAVPDTLLSCLSDGVNPAVTNLDTNDDLTYLWAPAELFDPMTITSATPTFVGNPGDYTATVTATNQYGCVATEDVQIIVIDDSSVLSFNPMVECDGSTVTFTNTSTASFGYVYDFGDGTSSTDANPVHVYEIPGTYTVTLDLVYDQNCVASVSQEVTTFPLVLDAGLSFSLDDCVNGSATLNFTDASTNATGVELSYDWTFTGVTPTTSTDQNPSVTISESGTVTATLRVTSVDDCTSAADTSFTVNLAVVNLSEEIIICPGDSTELNPGADEGLTYNWSPANGFDPADPNPTTSVAGTYIVTVTATSADFNCANTDTVTVIVADSIGLVISGPDGPLNGDDDNGGVIVLPSVATCGSPVDLTVDLTTNNGIDVVYTDLDGNVLGTGGTLTVNPDGRDTIVVTATNEFGCVERDTVVILNNQVNASIDVGVDGLNFCSSTDTTLSIVNFDPADTLTYAWGANAIINGSLINQTVNITSPAEGSVDVFVTVTNQFGCDTMLVVTVSATPFTPNQYADLIQPCFMDGFTINGGPRVEGYVYEWTPDENLDLTDPANPVGTFEEDGTLTVTITDPTTGCTETQTINVDVAPEISFMASPTDTVICEPADITISGSSVNEGVDIIWYDDEERNNQVGTGPTYVVQAAEVGQTYTVYGEATDPNTGCFQVVPVTVTVSNITTGLPLEDVEACAGDRPSIFAPGGVIGTLNYDYDPSGLIDDTDPSNPVFVGNSSATITVTATDPATGCSITQDVTISITDLGDLTGVAEPDTIFLGEESELTVIGECVGCTYEWMGGNGTITPSTGQTVTVVPDQAGDVTYEVEVTQNNCTRIVLITLRVEDPLCDFDHIYIPNAFTPNGDSRNEVMRVRSNFIDQLTDFRWIIYNRWGQEVYSSNDPNGGWDGTIEGDDLEPDVYGYWLRLTCPTGEPFIKQGNITILR